MYERGSIARAHLINSLRQATRFTITADHLRLVGRLSFNWDDGEYYEGAPAVIFVSKKRPYGNSDIEQDLAEILDPDGYETIDWDDPGAWDTYWAANGDRFLKTHVETCVVLNIICETGQFRTGHFIRPQSYFDRWRPGPGLDDICTDCGIGGSARRWPRPGPG